jgi:hypothetical protein
LTRPGAQSGVAASAPSGRGSSRRSPAAPRTCRYRERAGETTVATAKDHHRGDEVAGIGPAETAVARCLLACPSMKGARLLRSRPRRAAASRSMTVRSSQSGCGRFRSDREGPIKAQAKSAMPRGPDCLPRSTPRRRAAAFGRHISSSFAARQVWTARHTPVVFFTQRKKFCIPAGRMQSCTLTLTVSRRSMRGTWEIVETRVYRVCKVAGSN